MIEYLENKKESYLKRAYYGYAIDSHIEFVEKYWKDNDWITFIIHCEVLINRILSINLIENIESSEILYLFYESYKKIEDSNINAYSLIINNKLKWKLEEHKKFTNNDKGPWMRSTNLVFLLKENIKFGILNWTEDKQNEYWRQQIQKNKKDSENYFYGELICYEVEKITKKKIQNESYYSFGKDRIRNEIMHPKIFFIGMAGDEMYKDTAEFYKGFLIWILTASEPNIFFNSIFIEKEKDWNHPTNEIMKHFIKNKKIKIRD